MNINKLILDTLTVIPVPVAWLKYTGKEKTYIVFQVYNQLGTNFSEDTEETTTHYIQINIFSKTNYNDLVAQVKDLLIGAGFIRQNEFDLHEDGTGYYNHVIRFIYEE